MSTSDGDVISVSNVFQRGKTVIPSEVRNLLGLSDGKKVIWRYDKIREIIYIKIIKDGLVRYMRT